MFNNYVYLNLCTYVQISKLSEHDICHLIEVISFVEKNDMENNLSRDMRFPTMWYVLPAKAQTSLHIRAV